METAVQFDIDRMKEILEAASLRIGPDKDLEENREALKTMMFELMKGLANLVHTVGGDSLYIPDEGYLSDDIDNSFADPIEAYGASQPNYTAPYSTLNNKTAGIQSAVSVFRRRHDMPMNFGR